MPAVCAATGEHVSGPIPAPTLDEISANPALVQELSPHTCAALVTNAAAVVAALSARMIMVSTIDGNQEGRRDCRLLNIPTVAKLLGVPKSYAYELARRGELPQVKIGPKYVRVRPDDLEGYIARHRDAVSDTMRPISRKRGGR